MAELAQGVLRVVDEILEQRDEFRGTFAYAGDSVGGAVGLQLLLDHPDRVTSAVLLCTGARIGDAAMWAERIGQVERLGHLGDGLRLGASAGSAPASSTASPTTGLGAAARAAGRRRPGYIQVCEALADFDVRDRLGEITDARARGRRRARRRRPRPRARARSPSR